MTNIELPKDAEDREIPLDTEVLYNEDGKRFEVNRFTYSVVQTIPDLKWGVVFMDCSYDYCISFYLAPPELPDSWEKLEEDLIAFEDEQTYGPCHYFHELGDDCTSCVARDDACADAVMRDVASRIRNLRGENQ